MKKRTLLIVSGLMICTLLCACGKQYENGNNQSRNILKFTTDSLTSIKSYMTAYDENNSNETNTEKDAESSTESNTNSGILHGVLTISGEDSEPSYEVIDDMHIKYGNTTYMYLYENVCKMEIPYSKELFINFLVKTYEPTSDTVTTIVCSNEDSTGKTLAQELADIWSGYETVRNKYGTDVEYMIKLYQGANNRTSTIYSCSEYLLYRGEHGDMNVDMDKVNGGNTDEN